MRLLVDQNLSDRLVSRLRDRFPGSTHVKSLQLERSGDETIWGRCRSDGYVLLTKDRDFENEREPPGPPPKVILLLIGNSSTKRVEALLSRHAERIAAFEANSERILSLRWPDGFQD